MRQAQFPSLENVFFTNPGSGATRNLMHTVLMATNRHPDVIAVIVSEEHGEHSLVRVLLDTKNDSTLELDNKRVVFASDENLMLVLRDVLPQGRVHLFVDAPSQTIFVTPDNTACKILRFTNPRLNEAAEIVNKLSATARLSTLL